MIDFVEFGSLAIAHFVALLSPGPDFLLLMGCSIKYGYRKTIGTCLGIAVANGVYILLAVGGFSILRENALIFGGMKIIAAGYLMYLGMLLIKSARKNICTTEPRLEAPNIGHMQMFVRGFLSAILNPKNAIFYLSLMSVIVSQQTPIRHQLYYGGWMFSVVLLWDLLISFCIGSAFVRQVLDAHTYRIERFSGLLLMVAGGFLVLK